MTSIGNGASFLGSSSAQIRRLNTMRAQLDDLQRQVGTQKKHETLAGFGIDSSRLLQLRAERDQLQAYSANIESAISRMTLISDSITKITEGANKMISFLQNQPADASFDAASMNNQAQQMMEFVRDVANIDLAGVYLFSGTDTRTAPVENLSTLKTNMGNELDDWLAGTITTTQLITNTDAYAGTGLGFSSTVASAQQVDVRIDRTLEISYGAIADRSGIDGILRALGMMANMRGPDPSTDIPDDAEFSDLVQHVLTVARNGVESLRVEQGKLSGSLDLAISIQVNHKQDVNTFGGQIDKAENTDAAEAITMLQALQTQMQASYQVTSIISQLSLVNFL